MKRLAFLMAIALSAACGGADEPAPAQPTTAEHPGHGDADAKPQHAQQGDAAKMKHDEAAHAEKHQHEGGEKHEHNFPPQVGELHDVLAPLWHAEPGDERTDQTCAAAGEMESRAIVIRDDPLPPEAAGKSSEWQAASKQLIASIEALKAACEADGRPEFDAKFKGVHEAFHGLVAHVGHEESR